MATFMIRTHKQVSKASEFFLKLNSELDIDKYKLEKYKDLFMLGSFQVMHDTDLAYHNIYMKCAQYGVSKDSLINCLEQEEKLPTNNQECFDSNIYRQNVLKVIAEIKYQLATGALDYLF
jgi:hypothetical protein